MANIIYKNGVLIADADTIRVQKGDRIQATYDDTGEKNKFIFDAEFVENIPVNGTIRVSGESTDVYNLQTNIAGDLANERLNDWYDSVESYEGNIKDLTIIGRGQGVRLDITTNDSGFIKFELLL